MEKKQTKLVALSGMEMAWEAQETRSMAVPRKLIHLLHTPHWREARKGPRKHAWPGEVTDRSSSHRPQHLLTRTATVLALQTGEGGHRRRRLWKTSAHREHGYGECPCATSKVRVWRSRRSICKFLCHLRYLIYFQAEMASWSAVKGPVTSLDDVTLHLPSPLWAQAPSAVTTMGSGSICMIQRLMRKKGVIFTLSKFRSLNVIWKQKACPLSLSYLKGRNEMARTRKANTTASQEKEEPWPLMIMESHPSPSANPSGHQPHPHLLI